LRVLSLGLFLITERKDNGHVTQTSLPNSGWFDVYIHLSGLVVSSNYFVSHVSVVRSGRTGEHAHHHTLQVIGAFRWARRSVRLRKQAEKYLKATLDDATWDVGKSSEELRFCSPISFRKTGPVKFATPLMRFVRLTDMLYRIRHLARIL
jgi:hypothetical protein